MSARVENFQPYLHIVEPSAPDTQYIHTPETFVQPPLEAFLTLSQEGLQLGDRTVYTDKKGKDHITTVLHSAMYDMRLNTQTGDVSAFFHQYTTFNTRDEYGLYHPRKVPQQRLYRDEAGNIQQDNTPRDLAYTSPEAQRVLVVTYNTQSGKVESGYVHARNLRYALPDKERLEKMRANMQSRGVIDEIPMNPREELFLAAD